MHVVDYTLLFAFENCNVGLCTYSQMQLLAKDFSNVSLTEDIKFSKSVIFL